jgi:3-isopropylmalate dehydrogenase
MLLRYTLDEPAIADQIEAAVEGVLDDGLRTPDLGDGGNTVGTAAMGDAVLERLSAAG